MKAELNKSVTGGFALAQLSKSMIDEREKVSC